MSRNRFLHLVPARSPTALSVSPLSSQQATWLGSADAPQGCKPALDQGKRRWLLKAAQNPAKQSAGCSSIFVYRENRHIKGSTGLCYTRMQTCCWPRSEALASKKQLRILSKAIRRMLRYLFVENRSTYSRLDGALLMRQKHWLPKSSSES